MYPIIASKTKDHNLTPFSANATAMHAKHTVQILQFESLTTRQHQFPSFSYYYVLDHPSWTH